MFTIESILADRRQTPTDSHRPPNRLRSEYPADAADAVTRHGASVSGGRGRGRTISPSRDETTAAESSFGSRTQQPIASPATAVGGRKRCLSDGEDDISGLFCSNFTVIILYYYIIIAI